MGCAAGLVVPAFLIAIEAVAYLGKPMGEADMAIERIQPGGVAPTNRYSHVVRAGDTVYIAGQTARDADGNIVGEGDAGAQTDQIMKNIAACLASVGASWEQVVRTRVYQTDPAQMGAVREARDQHLPKDHLPASTSLFVAGLVDPAFLIEIDAVSYLGEPTGGSDMAIERIQPDGVAPTNRYSHVVRAGDTVYIAGQTARDADGNIVGEGDAGVQTDQIMKNIAACLASVGGTLDNLVSVTIYLTAPEQADRVREARAKYQRPDALPASTFVFISGLAAPEYLVEIEAVAYLG